MYRSFCRLTIPFSVKVFASIVFYQVSKLLFRWGFCCKIFKIIILKYKEDGGCDCPLETFQLWSWETNLFIWPSPVPKVPFLALPLACVLCCLQQVASQHVHCASLCLSGRCVESLQVPSPSARAMGFTVSMLLAATLIAHKSIQKRSIQQWGEFVPGTSLLALITKCRNNGANCHNAVCRSCSICSYIIIIPSMSPSLDCFHWPYSKCYSNVATTTTRVCTYSMCWSMVALSGKLSATSFPAYFKVGAMRPQSHWMI